MLVEVSEVKEDQIVVSAKLTFGLGVSPLSLCNDSVCRIPALL